MYPKAAVILRAELQIVDGVWAYAYVWSAVSPRSRDAHGKCSRVWYRQSEAIYEPGRPPQEFCRAPMAEAETPCCHLAQLRHFGCELT